MSRPKKNNCQSMAEVLAARKARRQWYRNDHKRLEALAAWLRGGTRRELIAVNGGFRMQDEWDNRQVDGTDLRAVIDTATRRCASPRGTEP